MKKIVIAMFLVLALTASAFAASFADVPSSHWAYEAVNKLVASGILSGYPDGTFKGQNNLSRYEIAVVVARVLDQIEAEQAALAAEIADADSLSVGQAQQVNEIVKAIVARNTGEELSNEQANEVRSIVQALTFEFRPELKEIGAAVDALAVDVDELDSRVSALEEQPRDNVSIAGTVTTYLQTGSYGDDPEATAEALADGDALDIDLPGKTSDDDGDQDDFPAEKAFYQEIDFNVNGNINEVNFDLAVDTITNGFTDYESYEYRDYKLGDQGNDDGDPIKMDTALLTISKNDYTFKAGDMGDYTAESYFFDDEDMEGIEFTAPVGDGLELKTMAFGYDDGSSDEEYYGVNLTKDFGKTQVTGKVYQGIDIDSQKESVTDVALAVNSAVTDLLNLSGEVVYNQLDDADTDDMLFNLNADYQLTDMLSLRAGIESVGDEFNGGRDKYAGAQSDLEEDFDYDLYTLGTDYKFDDNNTLKFDYSFIKHEEGVEVFGLPVPTSDTDDKSVYRLQLDNVAGAFNNMFFVEFIENDYYLSDIDNDATVFGIGTEYTMSDLTTLSASVVNKSADLYDNSDVWDTDMKYTYLTAGIDHQLTDNINWLTDLKYIVGDVDQVATGNSADIEGNFLTTQLSVSF
ncbi:MAG: S-layer homology domain-containing protein [Firmicutes bacterium]|nr:S-layer homology domain-containing protein [Bacillota bacterium]